MFNRKKKTFLCSLGSKLSLPDNKLLGLYIIPGCSNGSTYLSFLPNEFGEMLNNSPLAPFRSLKWYHKEVHVHIMGELLKNI